MKIDSYCYANEGFPKNGVIRIAAITNKTSSTQKFKDATFDSPKGIFRTRSQVSHKHLCIPANEAVDRGINIVAVGYVDLKQATKYRP